MLPHPHWIYPGLHPMASTTFQEAQNPLRIRKRLKTIPEERRQLVAHELGHLLTARAADVPCDRLVLSSDSTSLRQGEVGRVDLRFKPESLEDTLRGLVMAVGGLAGELNLMPSAEHLKKQKIEPALMHSVRDVETACDLLDTAEAKEWFQSPEAHRPLIDMAAMRRDGRELLERKTTVSEENGSGSGEQTSGKKHYFSQVERLFRSPLFCDALAAAREIQALLPESTYVGLMRALGNQPEANGIKVQATLEHWLNPMDADDMANVLDRFVRKHNKPLAQPDVLKKPEARQPAAWPRLFETETTRYGTFRTFTPTDGPA